MKRGITKLILCLVANIAASFPIFIVGSSFIFAGNSWGYFGVVSMIYAVVSCILLLCAISIFKILQCPPLTDTIAVQVGRLFQSDQRRNQEAY